MKRLLFIVHRVPYPPDKGERVRAFHEIRALSERFRVTVAALSHSRADAQAADRLRRHCHNVIVAPAAIEGLDLEIGRHLLRAESPQQWRQHIGCLLGSTRDRAQLGRAARECILERYTWPARMAPLVTLCERLCEARVPGGLDRPADDPSCEGPRPEGCDPALVCREEGAAG